MNSLVAFNLSCTHGSRHGSAELESKLKQNGFNSILNAKLFTWGVYKLFKTNIYIYIYIYIIY